MYLTHMKTSQIAALVSFVSMNLHFGTISWWALLVAIIAGFAENR